MPRQRKVWWAKLLTLCRHRHWPQNHTCRAHPDTPRCAPICPQTEKQMKLKLHPKHCIELWMRPYLNRPGTEVQRHQCTWENCPRQIWNAWDKCHLHSSVRPVTGQSTSLLIVWTGLSSTVLIQACWLIQIQFSCLVQIQACYLRVKVDMSQRACVASRIVTAITTPVWVTLGEVADWLRAIAPLWKWWGSNWGSFRRDSCVNHGLSGFGILWMLIVDLLHPYHLRDGFPAASSEKRQQHPE